MNATYLNPNQPTEQRVKDLLSRMTLDEKIAQLGAVWVYEIMKNKQFSHEKARSAFSSGIGQITRIGGASSLDPRQVAELANEIQRFLKENTRLGIPALVHEESCSGYMAKGATCFPQTIGVSCTWNPDLVYEMGIVIRDQMKAAGAHQALAPLLDVARDPRWGRTEETFGEDPYLTSVFGVSYINGLQGDSLKEGVLATGKHFVGYGLSEGGMNWAPAHIPSRELAEVFMLPFEAAVKEAHLRSIMPAYHELDSVPCHSSKELLVDILRNEWHFNGLVVSDYFAIKMLHEYHHLAGSRQEAAQMALESGVDIELPSTDCYGSPLKDRVEQGAINEEQIDVAVARILTAKFDLGLFEHPYIDTNRVVEVMDTPSQRALARQMAQESIVLLKNDRGLLPLSKQIKTIAVIGPNADSVRNLCGDYSYPSHMESLLEQIGDNVFNTPVPDSLEASDHFVPITSILQAITARVSEETNILYARGCDVIDPDQSGFAEAIAAARQADLVVMVVGDKAGLSDSCTTGESRDRADLDLPGVQKELIQAIQDTGAVVVAVLVSGRPMSIQWMQDSIPAIVEAWLPGEEGGQAVVDVLFGDYNPSGKLTMSFPRSVGQIPLYYNHKPSGGRSHWKGDYVGLSTKPLYPFGHGLSYTEFAYSNLQLQQPIVGPEDEVTWTVDVQNVGSVQGEEVVQVYIHDLEASVTRPVQELKAFKRVSLAPGERRTVLFRLSVSQLGVYDQHREYFVEPGTMEVQVGSSSEAIHLRGTFAISGERLKVENRKFISEAFVQ